MKFGSYLQVKSVYSNEGFEVKCRYLDMEEFDPTNSLCQTLHYCFCSYGSNRSYSSTCNARAAIEEFLKFREWFNNRNPEALQLHALSDIFVEPLRTYLDYRQKRKLPLKPIRSLKNMLSVMSEFDAAFPNILFPKLPKEQTFPNPPLEDQAIDKLDAALKSHVEKLYHKVEYRKEVHEAQPYNYEEILEICYPSGTKKNVYEWYRHSLNNYSTPKVIQVGGVLKKLRNLDPDFQRCLEATEPKKEFIKLYEQESPAYLADKEYNPYEFEGIRRWLPDYTRLLKTFLVHDYPFAVPFKEAIAINTATTYSMKYCKDVISVIFHRFVRTRYIPKRLQNTGIPIISLDELLNLYYPNQEDMAVLMLMIQFQAGWNKETVIAVDRDDFEHGLSGIIDDSQRLITSEKKRGQNTHLPYYKSKTMLAVSNTKDKHSIYNLIKLADDLSSPLSSLEPDELTAYQIGHNRLFSCTTDLADWSKKSRFSSMSNTKTSTRGVRDFLRNNEISDKGERLTRSGEIVNRMRPTWMYIKRKTDPLSLVQLAAGHSSIETTDIHYDSSEQSTRSRKERLTKELHVLMDKLRSRKFSGLMPAQYTKEEDSTIAVFSIPGHNRELWACRNQRLPTWRNYENFIRAGEKCFFLNKCLNCSQIQLFNDSLPYLLERLDYLNKCSQDMPLIEFTQLFCSEYETLKWIIDNWEDGDEVKAARRFQRRNSPLLPKDLASLNPLMKLLSEVTQDNSFLEASND
ncbi:hypothetical protein [Rheinheimera soli]|uniref:hypothetical protein n=1 Tax=Rheinheimera soli TaxID=443616 RepID=UPI001E2F673D|nr:hypothetical protein [Rheinheimera soli]